MMSHPITDRYFGLKLRSLAVGVLLACVGVMISIDDVAAHPRHLSIAEADWNAETQRLEIALQVNPVDLEQALRRIANRPIDLDRTAGIDRLMEDYLGRTFFAKERDGGNAKLIWVGHEINLKDAWLYFEVPLKSGPVNATFGAGLFFELLPDQANTINFKVGKLRKSLTFTADQLEAVLR